MQSESKVLAMNEFSTRNEILSESIEKIKLELFNTRTALSKTENEKFDYEKENLKLKSDLKNYIR
jgi:hypothetical protein